MFGVSRSLFLGDEHVGYSAGVDAGDHHVLVVASRFFSGGYVQAGQLARILLNGTPGVAVDTKKSTSAVWNLAQLRPRSCRCPGQSGRSVHGVRERRAGRASSYPCDRRFSSAQLGWM